MRQVFMLVLSLRTTLTALLFVLLLLRVLRWE
jgi:hypothetical protein